MRLTMKEKKAVTRQVAQRYFKATKKQKGLMLDEFVFTTGYTRSYARSVLRRWGARIHMRVSDRHYFVEPERPTHKNKRRKERLYDNKVLSSLRSVWIVSDYLCGKRLAPFLRESIPVLERFGEISLDSDTRTRLLSISAATIDRLLKADKKKMSLKSKSRTKPGTLLKHQIPIRTFCQWDDARPGFCEMDLVGHDGGDASGEYAQTLDVTDIRTAWTETEAVRNKAQKWVFEALGHIIENLPFDLLGLDSDNGSEFINAHLFRFCKENSITFTRARSSRKNDNCYVEQKNWSVVRRAAGYMRYDTPEELETLNEIYKHLRLYTNFFQPVMKLKEKTREGSKVTKRYDVPKTPYRRVLESEQVDEEVKERLKRQYITLNPAELKRSIAKLQEKLFKLSTSKPRRKTRNDFEYIYT